MSGRLAAPTSKLGAGAGTGASSGWCPRRVEGLTLRVRCLSRIAIASCFWFWRRARPSRCCVSRSCTSAMKVGKALNLLRSYCAGCARQPLRLHWRYCELHLDLLDRIHQACIAHAASFFCLALPNLLKQIQTVSNLIRMNCVASLQYFVIRSAKE